MSRLPGSRGRASNLSVRQATLKDLDVLVYQRRAMWTDMGIRDQADHTRGDKAYRRWAESRIRNGRLMAWIAESPNGRVAGGGCLWLQPAQPFPQGSGLLQPYLLSMYTEPEFRRHGVASMIVNEAIQWCKRKGYKRLRLHASEMGRGVYNKLGFKRGWEMRLDVDRLPVGPTDRKRSAIRTTIHA